MKSPSPRLAVCFAVLLLFPWAAPMPAQSPPTVHNTPTATSLNEPVEVIPPTPTHWFSDYAKVTSPIFAIELDRRLEGVEHETSEQFLVVILSKMQSDAPLDDYCLRVFNAWHVGQKGINNGVILFVFVEDQKLRIEVGLGLKTSLTDPVCQGIVKAIVAGFQRGDYEAGITTGVDAIVKVLEVQPHRTAP